MNIQKTHILLKETKVLGMCFAQQTNCLTIHFSTPKNVIMNIIQIIVFCYYLLFSLHVCASIEGNSHQIPPPSTSFTSCIMFSFQQIIRASIYISTMYFLFKLDIFVSVLSGNKTTAAFYQIYYKN